MKKTAGLIIILIFVGGNVFLLPQQQAQSKEEQQTKKPPVSPEKKAEEATETIPKEQLKIERPPYDPGGRRDPFTFKPGEKQH